MRKIHFVWSPRAKVSACGERVTDQFEVGTILPFDAIVLYCSNLEPRKASDPQFPLDRRTIELSRTRALRSAPPVRGAGRRE